MLAWAWPRIPDQVVVHVGVSGHRSGSPLELLTVLGVIGGVSYVLLAVLSLKVGRTAMARRLVLGLASGTAVFFTGLGLAFLLPQVDGRPLAVDLPLALATLGSLAAGLAAAAFAGRDPVIPATEPVPVDAPRLTDRSVAARSQDGGAGWQQRVALGRGHAILLGIAAVAYGLGAVWLGWATASWYLGGLMLVPIPLVAAMTVAWEVRVDAAGLTARGAWGWPRYHVPASEVVRADVTHVDPLGEFGGWGLRIAGDTRGTVGVVLRNGEAISVERTGGRRVVVTVDDALTGAATLNSIAEGARPVCT